MILSPASFGGGAAGYMLHYGRTRVLDDGILLGNTLCEWKNVDHWELDKVGETAQCPIFVAAGQWKPGFWVAKDILEELRLFLNEKVQPNVH